MAKIKLFDSFLGSSQGCLTISSLLSESYGVYTSSISLGNFSNFPYREWDKFKEDFSNFYKTGNNKSEIKTINYRIASFLIKHNFIEFKKFWEYPAYKRNKDGRIVERLKDKSDIEVIYDINSKSRLRKLILDLLREIVHQPYGIEKQARIIKKVLREKFTSYENINLRLINSDISSKDFENIQLFDVLEYLKNLKYINYKLDKFRLRMDEMGKRKFYFDINIRLDEVLLREWADEVGFSYQDIAFDKNKGSLFIENENYDICKPESIDCDFLDYFISNINTIISYEDLSEIVWRQSKELLEKKYKEIGKTGVHEKVTQRKKDLEKKFKKFKLGDRLKFEANKGYKLVYLPYKNQINLSALVESLASKISADDIPF